MINICLRNEDVLDLYAIFDPRVIRRSDFGDDATPWSLCAYLLKSLGCALSSLSRYLGHSLDAKKSRKRGLWVS